MLDRLQTSVPGIGGWSAAHPTGLIHAKEGRLERLQKTEDSP